MNKLIGFSLLTLGVHAQQPNVLFIAADDLRPDLVCYGEAHMVTPNIDRLASQGRIFPTTTSRSRPVKPRATPS